MIAVIFLRKKDSQIHLKGIFIKREYVLWSNKFKKSKSDRSSLWPLLKLGFLSYEQKMEEKRRTKEYEVKSCKDLEEFYEGIEDLN